MKGGIVNSVLLGEGFEENECSADDFLDLCLNKAGEDGNTTLLGHVVPECFLEQEKGGTNLFP